MKRLLMENLEQQFNLSDNAMSLIMNIRNSEPSRKVSSNGKNVHGFYPSKKMGLTIQFESHKLELAAIYEKEHSSEVIEYYDQPPSFTLNYFSPKAKKNLGHRYTPDFFIIEKNWVGWEEWKTEEELIKLFNKNPNRYCMDEQGEWRCPPGEAYANQFGLSFRVKSSKQIDWTFQRNLQFLEDFLLEENPKVSSLASNTIKKIVQDKPYILLKDLLDDPLNYTADDIYTLIACDEIYVNLYKYLIIDFDRFPIYPNYETFLAYENLQKTKTEPLFNANKIYLKVGLRIHWDGRIWSVINVGNNFITLISGQKDSSEIPINVFKDLISEKVIIVIDEPIVNKNEEDALNILMSVGEKELERANKRYEVVSGMLNGLGYSDFDVSDRTIRDWLKKYREAEQLFGNGYVGLISRTNLQGNRTSRIQDEVKNFMVQYISDNYESIIQKNRQSVYSSFKVFCEQKGWTAPSYKTFCEEVKARPSHKQLQKRQGSKAAYEKEQFYFELHHTLPRHGDRPFEICHIDHTELDIELLCSESRENLGRPWITFLVDAFSRRLLAFYLTFDAPSYRSTMMVMRECVKVHNRLPDKLVVDGGKEFHSVYFDTLLARYRIVKKVRPGAKPKFGSVCERLFGTTNTMFIHNLLGNTQIMKSVRKVTKEVNPKIHAVWTLGELNQMMEEWCYEVYDSIPHSALDMSPRDCFIRRIAKSGARNNQLIIYDETFEMLTLPTTKKGTAKVIPGQGVKINYFYYWSDILLHPENEGNSVPIRFDPYDLSTAYAYVQTYWVKLTSHNYTLLNNRTEKELKLVTAEIKKRKKLNKIKKDTSSSEIVSFLESAESYEVIRKQQMRDNALRNMLTVVDGGKSKAINNIEKNEIINDYQESVNQEIGLGTIKSKGTYKDVLQKMEQNKSFEIYKEL